MTGVQFPAGTSIILLNPILDQLWDPPSLPTNEHPVAELVMAELPSLDKHKCKIIGKALEPII